MTGQEFIEKYRVEERHERIEKRDDGCWADNSEAKHYRVKLTSLGGGREFVTTYSIGSALTEADVNAHEVLEAMASDASAYENAEDVADFVFEFGYAVNASALREGMAAYRGCEESKSKLQLLFGLEGYEELLQVEWD